VGGATPGLEAREDRLLVRLGDDRLAWFPANGRGRERLMRERRVLRLLAERCSFRVPRLLFESAEGWDVRAAVPGTVDPWQLYGRVRVDSGLARRIGATLGQMLAEQHSRIRPDELVGWLSEQPDWPAPAITLRGGLAEVVADRQLLGELEAVLDANERAPVAADDRVLVHGDLGLHNIAVDAAGAVEGIFDYDGASCSDRHHDFRYLLFDECNEAMLEAALAVYEPVVGRRLSRARIRLANAACAIGFLADRHGTPAEARPAGRTLAEDLQWVRAALGRL